jgi:hypothetical protein
MHDTGRMKIILTIAMMIVWAGVMLLLSGCATYNISRCEAGVCSTAKIVSPRKFKSISFSYNGEARTFELQAGDVGTDVTAIQALAGVIMMQSQQQLNPE